MRRFLGSAMLVLGASAILVRASGPDAPATEPGNAAGLVLRVLPVQPVAIMLGEIAFEWQLENTGKKPVYICQWPGIAWTQSWTCPDGRNMAGGPGYPESRALDRKYFLELKPGEALIGHDRVDVWDTPSGKLSIRGEYRCDQTGAEHGLTAWRGRIGSERVEVEVPADPNAKSCKR